MKINYRNTALELLDSPTPTEYEINVPESHVPMTEEEKRRFGLSVLDGLEKTGKTMFGSKIQYISQPFIEAYNLGKHKLAGIFDKEPMEEHGTFIWQAGSFTHTNFYYVNTKIIDGVWQADYMFIQFSKHAQNDFKSIDVCISGKEIDGKVEEKTFIWKGHYDNGFNHTHYFAFIVTFLVFIKHVELETKIVNANKKEVHIGTKYVNETKSNIEILDSTWFTTIVRSEGFDVRGHFRFQPFGPALQQRKLIWISDFEKHGYTRKAKILNSNL